MSYESAPSTVLLATHCAICHRPLRDAASVERGVGPDCAEKYGYGDAQGAADWRAVQAALSGAAEITHAPDQMDAFAAQDAHKLANVLVHRVACDPKDARVPAYVAAIRACGYTRLADTLAGRAEDKRAPVVAIEYAGDVATVTTRNLDDAAFAGFLRVVRETPGRRWDPSRKVNTFPVASKRAFWTLCQRYLPAGVAVRSPRGAATVTEAHAG